jgi:hypothetical protein
MFLLISIKTAQPAQVASGLFSPLIWFHDDTFHHALKRVPLDGLFLNRRLFTLLCHIFLEHV